MTRVTVNVVEVNRMRLVGLEGIALALAEAIDAGAKSGRHDEHGILEPARQLRRALAALLEQPLPEARWPAVEGQSVELEAPAHELEQLAEELETFADSGRIPTTAELVALAVRLRTRAAARA